MKSNLPQYYWLASLHLTWITFLILCNIYSIHINIPYTQSTLLQAAVSCYRLLLLRLQLPSPLPLASLPLSLPLSLPGRRHHQRRTRCHCRRPPPPAATLTCAMCEIHCMFLRHNSRVLHVYSSLRT